MQAAGTNRSVVIQESHFPGQHTSLYLPGFKASTKAETFYI